jgi:hypothetical protein
LIYKCTLIKFCCGAFAQMPLPASPFITSFSKKVQHFLSLLLAFSLFLISPLLAFSASEAAMPLRGAASPVVITSPSTSPSTSNASSPLRSRSSSQRLPAGTLLKVRFLSELDSRLSQADEPFTAILVEDLYAPGAILVLPKGSTLRGRVAKSYRSKWFSKGGELAVNFDHVVLSNGLQQPIALRLSLANAKVTPNGAFNADPGLGRKVAEHFDEGSTLMQNVTQSGVKAGRDVAGGAGMIVTVPVAAVGGALAGAGVFAGKSIYSSIAPGENVTIRPEDALLLELSEDTTFPSE